jgi:hypothetical protein
LRATGEPTVVRVETELSDRSLIYKVAQFPDGDIVDPSAAALYTR